MMETMEVVVDKVVFRWMWELTAPATYIIILMKTTCQLEVEVLMSHQLIIAKNYHYVVALGAVVAIILGKSLRG